MFSSVSDVTKELFTPASTIYQPKWQLIPSLPGEDDELRKMFALEANDFK